MSPTPRLLGVLLAGLPLAALPALLGDSWWGPWVVLLGALAVMLVVEALVCPRPGRMTATLDLPDSIPIGEQGRLTVTLESPRPVSQVLVTADLDERLEEVGAQAVDVPAGGEGQVEFPLVPTERGALEVRQLWLRWRGPLGLLRRTVVRTIGREVAVLPHYGAARSAAQRVFRQSQLMGARRQRYVGEGSEFDSLREYQPGFDLRSVDWKATARHRKLLSREYMAERNHQLILAFDTGRLMAERADGISKLDRALPSALALAYVSLKAGDAVGLFGFDEQVRHYLPPRKGTATIPRLHRLSAELETRPVETNFTLGLTELSRRLKRRALVVVWTDFQDSVTADLMVDHLSRLTVRHLVVCVTLRDTSLDRLVTQEPRRVEDLHHSVVAHTLARDREQVLRRLQRSGVQVIDAPWKLVPPQVIDRYLSIKRRGEL